MLYGPVLPCCMDQCCHTVWTSGAQHCHSIAMLYGQVEFSTAPVLPYCMDHWSQALPVLPHIWTIQHSHSGATLYGSVMPRTTTVLPCCIDQWSPALLPCCHAVWTSGAETATVLPCCMDQWSPVLPQCYHTVWTSGAQHCHSVAMLYGSVDSSTASVLPR